MGGLGRAGAADHVAAGDRDEVAEHRRGGLHSPGARAVEHERAGRGCLDEDRVVGAVHGRERVAAGHERRVDACRDALVAGLVVDEPLADREELDHVARPLGRLDLLGRDAGDALAVHRVDGHARVEGEAREDGGLLRGVVAADVGRGVGLGVAELGRGGERRLEGCPGLVHAVEDEVRGAVDDAEDAVDAVAREAVAQRPDDGDRPADGRLVGELGAHLLRRREQFGAVRGEQGLVARDDVGARGDGREHEGAGRLETAHELDDDVGAVDERLGVGGEQLGRQVDVALRARVAHRDADELDARADALRELVGVLEEQAGDLRADRTGAEEPDSNGAVLDHAGVPSVERSTGSGSSPASRASRSASVSPCTITRASPSRTATTGGRGTWL